VSRGSWGYSAGHYRNVGGSERKIVNLRHNSTLEKMLQMYAEIWSQAAQKVNKCLIIVAFIDIYELVAITII
jgi:hypothetical protein